jgi:hypothetical protein
MATIVLVSTSLLPEAAHVGPLMLTPLPDGERRIGLPASGNRGLRQASLHDGR